MHDKVELCIVLMFVNVLFRFGHCGSLPVSQQVEQTLIQNITTGYNKKTRPDDQVFVALTTKLQQIISIDEKQQIMTSSSFISQMWTDERLSWTPNAFNNIEVVMLSVKDLWIPDTMILNSADASGYLPINDYSLASVYYTGDVYMILPTLTIRTRCGSNVRKFPFDKQICAINVTSWSQGTNRIAYTGNSSDVIDLSQYIEHPLWELTDVQIEVIEAVDRVPFETTQNDIISIQLYLQRKPLFFMFNGIFACLVLNFVTLLSFALPFAPQITLCMTSFMTYSVYSLNFSNLFPQQSEYLMTITLYFLFSISWTLISMTWFVVCEHLKSQGEMIRPIDHFAGFFQRLLSFCHVLPKVEVDGQIHPIDREEKSTCGFCKRCSSCQNDFDKEKQKQKMKKSFLNRCSALNLFVFFFVFLLMLISNLVLWISMSI